MMKRYYVILICLVLLCGFGFKKYVRGGYPATGTASWYNPRRTASGEIYSKGQLTCAMRKRDFGRSYLVCNSKNNKCVVVKQNDFGPALYLFAIGRVVDLNRDAFSKIADRKKGVIRVRLGEVYSGQTD